MNFIGFNKEALNTFKLQSEEEVLGKSDFELPWSEKANIFAKQDEYVLNGNSQFNIDHSICADGTETRVLVKKAPFYSDCGKIIGLSGVGFQLSQDKYGYFLNFLATIPETEFNNSHLVDKNKFQYGSIEFTYKQAEVISYLLRGFSASAIGKKLHKSKRTIESHIEGIKGVLDCKTKGELINKAFEKGFIELICLGKAE